ncbi:MAG: ABC transporter substrate-binding protein [Armatimonadota bacterium]
MTSQFQCNKSARLCFLALAVVATVSLLTAVTGCGRKAPNTTATGEKSYRVAFASFGPDAAADNAIKGYIDGLAAEGIIEGKNLTVIRKHAFGEISQLPLLMQSLESQNIDLIVPMSTPGLQAAFGAVKKTPMVFVYTYDPLGAGAGKSLTDHLPNVTGVGSFPPIEGTMEVILKLYPNIKKVGTIYNASEANSVKAVKVARDVLKAKGISLEEVTVTGTADVHMAAQALISRKPEVIWVTGDNTVLQALEGVIKPATSAHLPVIMNDPEFVDRGALAAVGIGWHTSGMAAGKMAAKVLRGESPAGMPIVELAERSIVINQKVAKELGVTFPPEIVKEAVQQIK